MVSPLMPFTPVKNRNGRRTITPRSIPVTAARKRKLMEVAEASARSPLLAPRKMRARTYSFKSEREVSTTKEGSPNGGARKRIKTGIKGKETHDLVKADTEKEIHEVTKLETEEDIQEESKVMPHEKSDEKDWGTCESEKCKAKAE
ncbi:hypothetical protein K440DRAFT_674048 [Wilcoxina mikolae CBS 423.85]|nr:hypothetical protein K440DRAFT_674048 [Wilcoxina mikolae CBS 423.85]